jgi:hypothetical protein
MIVYDACRAMLGMTDLLRRAQGQRDRAKRHPLAVIPDVTNPAGIGQSGVINAMAPSLRVEVIPG